MGSDRPNTCSELDSVIFGPADITAFRWPVLAQAGRQALGGWGFAAGLASERISCSLAIDIYTDITEATRRMVMLVPTLLLVLKTPFAPTQGPTPLEMRTTFSGSVCTESTQLLVVCTGETVALAFLPSRLP